MCIIGRMPFRALLMRLLLIVALLANGPAIAGVSMHMEHLGDASSDVTPVTIVQTAAEAVAACHGAAETAVTERADHHPQVADQAKTASPSDNCCEAGDCCACMHHCFVALAGSSPADMSLRYPQLAESFRSVHASASLSNLFRPPIG